MENRHLYGDMLPIKVDVPDCVKVLPGDLMILRLGSADSRCIHVSLRNASGGSYYAYPMAAGATLGFVGGVTYPFLGLALDNSSYGSTDTIMVAQAGVFEMELNAQAGVTIGSIIQAIAPTGFSKTSRTTASYKVLQASGGGVSIGYCHKTEASAKTARVLLRTKFGPGGIVEST